MRDPLIAFVEGESRASASRGATPLSILGSRIRQNSGPMVGLELGWPRQ
jgi:hypothetical protein